MACKELVASGEFNSVEYNDTLYDASMILINYEVPCVIVEKSGSWIGAISLKDIVTFCVLRGMDPEMGEVQDAFRVKGNVAIADPETSLSEAIEIMKNENQTEIVVASEEKVLGVLTAVDIALALDGKGEQQHGSNFAPNDDDNNTIL
eukprot:CAMPEP_0197519988 /NCGR_PEP_ID=MMETSP1318-20131121/5288_1 /TAXON_ID=552666 /ORGANISM="Partenskyella glossopodia, Strain RCC365" /LENGTH=147 /DNA_ID=CAMNT_0043071297 /DNA_START=56 /DNA_END=499 /DNA_ORIENTATION=-